MNRISRTVIGIAVIMLTFAGTAFAQVENPTDIIGELPDEIEETSGLVFINGKVWTHNDSGGEPILYSIDTATGEILERKTIAGVTNEDWEDIANDRDYVYIGNVGAMSSHLQVIRIKIEDLENPELDVIQPRIINFTYGNEDYPEPNFSATNTRFDCEAIIAKDDTIFLFSKNWIDHKTYLYGLPNKANFFHSITPIDTLELNYLVCGADYNYRTNTVALVGYTYDVSSTIPESRPYITLLKDFEGNNFFRGTVETTEFSGLTIRYNQTEGITFRDSSRLWVSNEKYTRSVITIKPRLRQFMITNPVVVNEGEMPTFPEEPAPIIPDFTADQVEILEGDYVNFTDLSTENPTAWQWSFPGGTPSSSTEQNPRVRYNTPGTHNVSLTVSNMSSETTKTINNMILVHGIVTADFHSDINAICDGGSVHFYSDATNATNLQWVFDGGTPTSSTEQNPTVQYNEPGLYSVKLTASNEVDNDRVTKNEYIKVVGLVIANFSSETNSAGRGEIVQYNDMSENAYSWQWTFDGGIPATSTEQNPQVSYLDEGSYFVKLTAYSEDSICNDFKKVDNFIVINGIEEYLKENISIYPNPSSDILNITLPSAYVFDIEVTSTDGKVIFTSVSANGDTSIDISDIPSGNYIVKISNGDNTMKINMVKI